MKIESITTQFATNTYIVLGEFGTAVIDPGGSTQEILNKLKELKRVPDAVLLTHGHYDHTFSCAEFNKLGAIIYMSSLDNYLVENGGHLAKRGTIVEKFIYNDIADGQTIKVKDLSFSVMVTPGHTPGSVCYLLDNYIFSGDTLFKGTIGRTDLPGGDINQMQNSLKKIMSISQDYIVLPGHGPSTDLKTERRINPFLK